MPHVMFDDKTKIDEAIFFSPLSAPNIRSVALFIFVENIIIVIQCTWSGGKLGT